MENIIKSEKKVTIKKINSKEEIALRLIKLYLSLIKVLGGRGGTGRRATLRSLWEYFPWKFGLRPHQLRI